MSAKGREPAGEVVGCHEVGKVCSRPVVVFLVEAFDGRLLDGVVNSFDLAIGPRMVWLVEAVLDPVRLTDHVGPHLP